LCCRLRHQRHVIGQGFFVSLRLDLENISGFSSGVRDAAVEVAVLLGGTEASGVLGGKVDRRCENALVFVFTCEIAEEGEVVLEVNLLFQGRESPVLVVVEDESSVFVGLIVLNCRCKSVVVCEGLDEDCGGRQGYGGERVGSSEEKVCERRTNIMEKGEGRATEVPLNGGVGLVGHCMDEDEDNCAYERILCWKWH